MLPIFCYLLLFSNKTFPKFGTLEKFAFGHKRTLAPANLSFHLAQEFTS